MDDKLVREQAVCCCCGRTIPSHEQAFINYTDYTKPRAFCRRCHLAAPWPMPGRRNGTASNGGSHRRFGEPR